MSPIQSTKMTNFRWTVCMLLFFATMTTYMDRQVLSLTWKDFLAPEFGWTDADYGYLAGLFSLMYAICMLFCGKVMDIIGMRRGYLLSIGICTVGTLLHAICGIMMSGILADTWIVSFDGAIESLHDVGVAGTAITTMSIYLFLGCRSVMALGQAGNFPAAISVTAEYFPKKDRAFATSIFNNGASVGSLLAPVTIPLIAREFGWEMAFLLVGALGFLWMFAWLMLYESAGESHRVNISEYNYIQQDTVSSVQSYNENEKDTSDGIDSDIINDGKPISFLRCFSYRVTWAFIFGKFMTEGAWWFYLFWAPIYIADTYGYTTDSPMGMALIFTIYLISMLSVIGGYMPTYLTEEFSLTPQQARLRSMLGFACLQLIGLLQMPLGSHSPWVLVIIIGIFGAAHQSWSANLFSLVGDNIPKKSIATVIGIGGCAGGIASYLVMVFTGTLLQYANLMHDTFTFLGYSGKAAAYMMMFSIFSVSYLIGWGIIRLLSDYHITKNSIPNHERNN